MSSQSVPRTIWEPSDVQSTQIWKFKTSIEKKFNTLFQDYNALHQWSVDNRSDFWTHCLQTFPIIFSGQIPSPCVDESAPIETVPIWFQGVHLNFAQNILYSRLPSANAKSSTVSKHGKEDDKIAVTQVRELSSGEPIVHLTWSELRARVGKLSNAMRQRGVRKGDRIALIAGTSIDTLTVFLASASLGAIFSSSSVDMGVTGLLDRLLQIRPKFVFFDDAAVYNGKTINLLPKITEVIAGLHSVSEFESVITQPRFADRIDNLQNIPSPHRSKIETWEMFISSSSSANQQDTDGNIQLTFTPLAFHDPLLIVYSSGTTGPPKCIVHSHGGITLNGYKEVLLHRAMNASSIALQYTTTGWIMYLGSVQALLSGARMICYDGSPFLPDVTSFVKLLSDQRVTHLGTSPRYLATLQQRGLKPREIVDLKSLEVVTSTGSVLSDAIFEWFYDVAFPTHVQLDNISGGTDLAGAWGTGNPMLPVWVGGCQCLSLGMAVEVFEDDDEESEGLESRSGQSSGLALKSSTSSSGSGSGEMMIPRGKRVKIGQPGDLVCTSAFPSMPVFFWGDSAASSNVSGGARIGQTYFNSYFARYASVWTHGDFIQIDPRTNQVFFLGRADGVLNPSGVRFGSSEIYSVIERHFSSEIADSLCVGQRRRQDQDERVLLFVLMKEGSASRFGPDLIMRVKDMIARELSKRHVPKFVFETKEIPVTVNGKKVELPVKKIVCGEKVKVSGTLANPGSLEFYKKFVEDRNLVEVGGEKAKL